MAAFGRSHHRCRVQKHLAMSFRSISLAAKGFDTAHALGISMSHSWVMNGVEKIAETANKTMRVNLDKYPIRGTHNNLNIPFPVTSSASTAVRTSIAGRLQPFISLQIRTLSVPTQLPIARSVWRVARTL